MNSTAQGLAARQRALPRLVQWAIYGSLLGLFMLGGALIIAYDVIIPSPVKVALQEGEVAPRDVLAPRSLKYESDVLTQAKRDAQVASVRPIYDPPDTSVASARISLARQILDYIENVRHDDFASLEQKRQDIQAITALELEVPVIDALLRIEDDATWQAIDAQVLRLLERIMSGEVREDNIQTKRENLPNLISASYSEAEVGIIKSIVGDLIQVNTFYNEERTREAQIQAAENVPVEIRTFARGQMIIRAGEIATAAHIEALDQFGLLQVTQRRASHLFSGLLAMGLVAALLGSYTRRFYPQVLRDQNLAVLLGLLFLIFLGGSHLVNSDGPVQPYYYPASALGFLVATLVGPQFAIIMIVTLAAIVGFMTNNSLELAVLISLGGILGVLSLNRTERLNTYFVAGGVVGLTSATIALLFALGSDVTFDWITVLSQIAGSIINGMLSAALTLVGLFAITNLLNIPTSLKIVELMQPNHPLLQQLLREAPGTYQHSLQVANLAELGAQQVNANGSLLRVAAMYHDVGKILNPHFFVENQADGVNPHDDWDDPVASARIIISHVTEGDRLSRRYRLPNRIRDFILEHHGTTQVAYFYQEALNRMEQGEGAVNIEDFTYPGPRPQSRETAILMLADGCESSVRARRPQSRQDIEETVDYIFQTRLREQQLDQSGLTLNDLRVLRDTFLAALQGIFHPRISYPGAPGQKAEALPPGETRSLAPGQGRANENGHAAPSEGMDVGQVSGGPVVEKQEAGRRRTE